MSAKSDWTNAEWDDAWTMIRGVWSTLGRDGAEQSYRAVLTRFAVDDVATVVAELIDTTSDEPKPADIAARLRAVIAHRKERERTAAGALPRDDDDGDQAQSEADAWRKAQRRHDRGASLGSAQWIALGCPYTHRPIDWPSHIDAEFPVRWVKDRRSDAERLEAVAETLRSPWGAYLRAGLRAAARHDHALAIRRLRHVMTPDEIDGLIAERTGAAA